MRAPRKGDLVEVNPMEALPGLGILKAVSLKTRPRFPYWVRILRPFDSFNVRVDEVHRVIVTFAGPVRV